MIVAATGGAAAVKTPFVLRRLREAGHEVRAAASEGAYRFVTPLSLALAAGGLVLDNESWFAPSGRALHLDWAAWADLLLVAPATADALAAAATGRADDVVSGLVLAGASKVAWAPGMNGVMWANPAVQRNVERLKLDGHAILGPSAGAMAAVGEAEGVGRMLEAEDLVGRVAALFSEGDLAGRHVLVSAGPTREYIDPVRFLSNPSSGKMGYEVAAAAVARGARVTLVSGPTSLAVPAGAETVRTISAEEMQGALTAAFPSCDALIMTAAVADWRPEVRATEKEPKGGERRVLELVRTPDILEQLSRGREHRILVGFAMETNAGVERAAEKARRKGLDFICLNYPTREGTGFGGDFNEVTLVTPDGTAEELPRMTKRALADRILDRVAARLDGIAPGSTSAET